MGGKLDVGEQDPLRLRVLLDGSVCEIFTSTGTVLTTRVNRCGLLTFGHMLVAGRLPAGLSAAGM